MSEADGTTDLASVEVPDICEKARTVHPYQRHPVAPAVVDEGNVTTYLSSTANAGVDQE
jgi:hypothetical protein